MGYSIDFYNSLKNNDMKRRGFRDFYVPEILNIFKEASEKLGSIIDVGCGTGTLLNEFMKQGVKEIKGLDFCDDEDLLEIPNDQFVKVDLNNISLNLLEQHYQLAICLECAEHLENTTADRLIEFLVNASDLIWFSAAIPYQGGDGHVNEQWPAYWENKFNSYGYVRIDWFRRKTWDNWDIVGYYRQNMMLYVNEKRLKDFPCLMEFYNQYNDVLPKHLVHPTVYNYSVRNAVKDLHYDSNPRVKLQEVNLMHARLLPNRTDLLKKLPKNGVVAEVGVAKGGFSREILDICHPKKLYCIDTWLDENAYLQTLEILKSEIENGIVEIMKGDSKEQLLKLKDEELDFVYIDAMHDYKHPKQELEICSEKVKKHGYIAGHDYTMIDSFMNPPERYGVINAVNEFIVYHDYEFLYLTMEHLFMNPSYCIRKIRKG